MARPAIGGVAQIRLAEGGGLFKIANIQTEPKVVKFEECKLKAPGESSEPVLLFYGSEKFLLEQSLKRLKKPFSSQTKDLDYQEFNGEKTELSDILTAAKTLPFASDRRLIVVRESEKLRLKDPAPLISYFKNPSSFTCLVFVAEKVDKKSSLYIGIRDYGKIFEYRSLKRSEYISWIDREFLKRGKRASNRVINLLLDSVGQDLNRLEREIDKISVYLGDQKEVGEKEVNVLIEKTLDAGVFDLVDSLGRREKAKTFEILDSLLRKGESPVFLLNMIIRQFRLLLKTKALLKRAIRGTELIKRLRVLPFVAAKLEKQCRNFSEEELIRTYELLLKADFSLKTSAQRPNLVLEILIHKI